MAPTPVWASIINLLSYLLRSNSRVYQSAYYEAMHRFRHTGFMAHAAVGWFPVTEDKVEDDWRDRGRDQHLARGERGLV